MDYVNGLRNSHCVFQQQEQGRVACMGGSITNMPGWRDQIWDFLAKMFSHVQSDFINAGIGGTDSSLGAARLECDVFRNGPVDLFFPEFVVNDQYSQRTQTESLRAMEGVIRHVRRIHPPIDVVMLYFAGQLKLECYRQKKIPSVIEVHERAASCCDIPAVHLAPLVHDVKVQTKVPLKWPIFLTAGMFLPISRHKQLWRELVIPDPMRSSSSNHSDKKTSKVAGTAVGFCNLQVTDFFGRHAK